MYSPQDFICKYSIGECKCIRQHECVECSLQKFIHECEHLQWCVHVQYSLQIHLCIWNFEDDTYSRWKHRHVHIGDYSPTELIVDIDGNEDHAWNYFHAGLICCMVGLLIDGREEASYVLFIIEDKQTLCKSNWLPVNLSLQVVVEEQWTGTMRITDTSHHRQTDTVHHPNEIVYRLTSRSLLHCLDRIHTCYEGGFTPPQVAIDLDVRATL